MSRSLFAVLWLTDASLTGALVNQNPQSLLRVKQASNFPQEWTMKANRTAAKVITKELMEVFDGQTSHDIEMLTAPTVPLEKCGGALDNEGLESGGGAYYGWCPNAIFKVIKQHGDDVKGLSYGIFTWDSWSRKLTNKYDVPTELYDCYVTTDESDKTMPTMKIKQYKTPYKFHQVCVGGKNETKTSNDKTKRFETLQMHLKDRKPLSTFVKMDIEGSEWEVLPQLLNSPKDLEKIALLDFEFHFCELEKLDTLKLLKKLSSDFAVSGRHPSAKTANLRGKCAEVAEAGSVPGPCMSVSYVNKRLLGQLHRSQQSGEQFPAVPDNKSWRKY